MHPPPSFFRRRGAKPDDFLDFWKEEQKLITEKNEFGFRPIDVGPVTMGYRLNTPKAGYSIARNLIYPKGAFIVHMVRMMMWTQEGGDKRFEETMQDLIQSHRLQAVTTEDFKAAIERAHGAGYGSWEERQDGLVLQRVCVWHRTAHLSL